MININTFYIEKEEPIKSCLLALRKIILDIDAITETQKWGMPCFLYKKQLFCYLWIDKKTLEPYILMVKGEDLNFPGLEKGNRSKMKIFRIDANQDIPIDTIQSLLKEALKLY
ncbi:MULTISPECIES: DUF1801 domain-containing protein [unclassified Tenacibaculum]|uniref:DUF1801 domain-containing protein n=1 Tax=Tenacibaculum TaxID=104267 RepID=UPI000898C8B8|nr:MULTISPECIES: DUF1801 domain-containing protein [unclassified Tenacibaculum]RBW56715.1 DUF1801 domain-containing protein [Tenacibaculum sp. E3R01]SEE55811.1 protein of unknown function (DU1801) [Tenacibaculum sp. MAR_2010_89]